MAIIAQALAVPTGGVLQSDNVSLPTNAPFSGPWFSFAELSSVGLSILGLVLIFSIWLITLRMQVRRKTKSLMRMSAMLNSSYEAIGEGILIVGNDGEFLNCTRRVSEILDRQVPEEKIPLRESLAKCMGDRLAFQELWNGVGATSRTETQEFPLRGGRGYVSVYTSPVLDDQGVAIARLWAFDDITKRKELEASLLQSQKMEAIGRLAGGVAHDFNNILMEISGNLELIQLTPEQSVSSVRELLEKTEQASDRAARLIKNLLGFSRRSAVELRFASVLPVVERLVQLLQYTLEPSIQLEETHAPDLWFVEFDEAQLQQVLLNICLNARDAILDKQGTITIATENTTLEGQEYVSISITDSGEGMSEEVRNKIFEPFFTTKAQGMGTGLGLALSYGIIQQHRGQIECTSSPQRGTTFRVMLPRATEAAKNKQQQVPQTDALRVDRDFHILLGDDSDAVRHYCAAILRSAGYRVTDFSNGAQVLQAFDSGPKVDLALIELTMPVMSGRETFCAIRSEYPNLPIIIYSGYAFDINDFIAATGEAPSAFIQKPFRRKQLLSVVQGALQSVEPLD
ncbi:hybrid sensor histidine kinase/response regulator [Aureliella helgolandensis]|uniref:histidine kinase n=1 Tax=Aureliella helgolandensis TaxID=2527968 RepID=A0A518G3Z1_9BACT|nr:PAS domain-containing sensor histidine kinase [Aureliella helgolandensis]QDV23314.1 Blue-light-activated protein [Aureliella helgolandensis]